MTFAAINLTINIFFCLQLKTEVALTADKKTSVLTWVGLGLMSMQFGILARLTWWEYSWDIMEPVTYFVTYGTAMAAYAYYCLTKQVSKMVCEHLQFVSCRRPFALLNLIWNNSWFWQFYSCISISEFFHIILIFMKQYQ